MAFNIQAFKTRTLTAIIFVAVMLAGILINPWIFLLLFCVIQCACWLEYQKLIEQIDPRCRQENMPTQKYSAICLGVGFILWMTSPRVYYLPEVNLHEIGKWLVLITLLVELAVQLINYKHFSIVRLKYYLLGLLYISLSCGLMIDLYCKEETSILSCGWIIPVVLIASIWINDTMAYIVGSLIGKTPFSSISPKKTWEGTIGGIVLATIIVVIATGIIIKEINGEALIFAAQFAAIAAIAGTAGDLLESKLKRMAGVKDSGVFMPGHGGFLDRFDSLLLATPCVWLFLKLVE